MVKSVRAFNEMKWDGGEYVLPLHSIRFRWFARKSHYILIYECVDIVYLHFERVPVWQLSGYRVILRSILLYSQQFFFLFFGFLPNEGPSTINRPVNHFSARIQRPMQRKPHERARKTSTTPTPLLSVIEIVIHNRSKWRSAAASSSFTCYLTHPKALTHSVISITLCRLFAFNRSSGHIHLFTSWAEIWLSRPATSAPADSIRQSALHENHRIRDDARLNEIKLHAVNHAIIAFRHWWWRQMAEDRQAKKETNARTQGKPYQINWLQIESRLQYSIQ